MRFLIHVSLAVLCLGAIAHAEDLEIVTRPDSIYVERFAGNITPIDRVFFHIILHNTSSMPITLQWVRFELHNGEQGTLSGQYSGNALTTLFDSAIDRRRIEPTAKQSLTLQPDQRKAISDVFLDCPAGFIGKDIVVEAQYEAGGKTSTRKTTAPLVRDAAFSGRLPFEGIWYVANEHGYLDQHKRFLAQAFAYDFIQVGANGKSYQRTGTQNIDYYAYGKKVLAAKDGAVVYVQTGLAENTPGTPNMSTPAGNVVIVDHGNNQFGYYSHMKPNTITVREGGKVKAGDFLGEAGNSGDSLEPQIHFHVMNLANPDEADGIPAVFTNWKSEAYGALPVPRDTGPLHKGDFVSP
jgi:murein DD-endopeptidase MepM/ murein hydrolase activator NlpD